MHFTRSLLLALSAAYATFAQSTGSGANPFDVPTTGFQATAGQPLKLTWKPTTSGTVSLILRSGSSDNLSEGTTIASKIDNSGSYTWTPATDTTRGSDYAIEIVSDSDPSATNFTPYFVLESDNTVAAPTSHVSLGAPTSSLDLSTAAPTASPSAYKTTTTTTNVSASMTTMTGTASASASASMTGSATQSSSSSATQSGVQTSQTASSATSAAGATRATVVAGMLGVMALGALAL